VDRVRDPSTSSDSESTSTLVDDTIAPHSPPACTKQTRINFFNEFDNDSGLDLPGIPTPRASNCNGLGFYQSPFADTSTVYGDIAEIPLVPTWTDHPSPTKDLVSHDPFFWSTLTRPHWTKPTKVMSVSAKSPPRCAPPLVHFSSVSSTSSCQTKVMPIKSSLSSSSSVKSKDGRRKHPSVKFAETPTIHYNHSYDSDDALPPLPHPRNTKPATEGSLVRLRRIVGSWGKSLERQQAAPARRPSISGPYPMYCAPALREHGRCAVHPARSCASIRSTGSASSGSGFRSIWDKFTRPDG